MTINKKYSGIFSFIVFTALPVLCSSTVTYYLLLNQDLIASFTNKDWLLTSIGLILASAFALCPPTFLAIVMGFFLGWRSFPFLVLINIGAIILIYALCKILNIKTLEEGLNANSKIAKVIQGIRKQELKFIFLTKLSPLFPFAVTNMVFAISGAKFWNIIFGGFSGMIPRTLLAVYIGTQAKELSKLVENPNENSWSKIIIGLLIIISAFGMFSIIKNSVNAS